MPSSLTTESREAPARAPGAGAVDLTPISSGVTPYAVPDFMRDELLHEMFAETAARTPSAWALSLAEPDPDSGRRDRLTYGELRQRASQFARHLRQRGVTRGDRVVICLPRGFDQYMTVLGVLEAGAAYVPVDWGYPADRVSYIAEECAASVLVTTSAREAEFTGGPQKIVIDDEIGDIAAQDAIPLTRADTGSEPGDLAYLIYTSGSTGRPKGVMLTHRNVCSQVRSESSILGTTAEDIVYASSSLAFDIHVEEMWGAFLPGGELMVGSESLAKAGPDLVETLARRGVTIWCPVPSLLAVMDQDVPSARIVNVGGEACPPDLVRRWATPGRRFTNTYGPTETCVTATWTELSPDRPVTIGKPLPGFLAWIVDDKLWPVPAGSEGELIIGGPTVSPGYLNRQDLTDAVFVQTPFNGPDGGPVRVYRTGDLVRLTTDGDIEFLGRIDTQVKIRGYRVELGEIEAVLTEDPAVGQAVVNLYREPDGSELLVGFLVPTRGQAIDLDTVRALLRTRLPSYMHPAALDIRDSLPSLVSGKVDRKALARPERIELAARELEPAATPSEESLLDAWTQVFAPQPVSVLDNFFEELGGHSLRAARMVSLARKHPELAGISIQDVYAAPTIRRLAARMDAARAAAPAAAPAETPFLPVPQWRRAVCVLGQTLALIPIFTFAGAQWIFPYLAYTWFATPALESRIFALAMAGLSFVAMPPLMILLSIVVKWVVLGRVKPGDYPLWGGYYFRWWLVRRFLSVMPTHYMAGTPMMRIYYRLLGARIGSGVYLGLRDIDAPDLVDIGRDAIISKNAVLATVGVERGLLRIGRVTVGERAFVGAMAVIGRDATVEDEANLDDLSLLQANATLPRRQMWSGSPAGPTGRSEARPPAPMVSLARRIAVTLGLMIAAPLLPLAAVLPIAPGLIGLMEIDWATTGYRYILLTPILALIYVISMCSLITAVKWLLLGRVKPGVYSLQSWFYIRFWFIEQLGELALDLVKPLYATLYLAPWYRALGAKIGPRAEISTASALVHDLIEVGGESFIADGVVFGAAKAEPGAIRLERTRIGIRSFLGNSALLPTGANIGDEVLIGVLSKPPQEAGASLETGSTWFGSPAIRLPNRQCVAVFAEGARFKPSKRLVSLRLFIEYFRVTLSLTALLALFSGLLTVIGDISERPHGALWMTLAFPFLYLGLALGAGVFTLLVKWLVIGRYKPTMKPLWSPFVWRSELVTSVYENLAVQILLEPLRGTPYLNIFLRMMGAKIGKRVFTDTTDITEHDLVRIGDDAALNDNAGIQTHLFEDRVMKVAGLDIGPRTSIGSLAVVLYDSVMEADSMLGDLSVLMKGESLPAGTSWEGSPARLATSPIRR
jgi:non-ribosomal peptide synthetase-like protein